MQDLNYHCLRLMGPMSRIHIIIGPFESTSFEHGLRLLLSQPVDFVVSSFDSVGDFDAALPGDQPSVLILEGTDPSAYLPYLEASEHVSVVMLDPVGARALFGVDNPNWERLADVIRAIAGQASAEVRAPLRERVRLVDTSDLLSVEDGVASSETMRPVTEWLDVTLACRLRELARRQTGPSVPGWALAADDALQLLGSELASGSDEDLSALQSELDERLIAERSTLPDPLREVVRVFPLLDEELRILLLVLAPELDGRYGTGFGVLQDDLTRRRPGLTALAEFLTGHDQAWTIREILARPGSIRDLGLVGPSDQGTSAPGVDVGYEPSPALVYHLLAGTPHESAAALGARLLRVEGWDLTPGEQTLIEMASRVISSTTAPIFSIRGRSHHPWVERVVAEIGYPVLRGDLTSLPSEHARSDAIASWSVFCALHQAALMVVGLSSLETAELARLSPLLHRARAQTPLLLMDGKSADLPLGPASAWTLDAPATTATERTRLWRDATDQAGLGLTDYEVRRLGATLYLKRSEIEACIALCPVAFEHAKSAASTVVSALQRTAREFRSQVIPPAVRSIETVFGWDDLILPKSTKGQLRTIPAHVVYSGFVLEEWGFDRRMPYGQGVAALFSGRSGTGKTMAAQIIARELGVELLQVDLSKTMSKYIGETEKNLDRVFDAAEEAGAVLLFDEADALFGKRTEIKDAHDRYANVEVAYLLQRMEAFSGLAILTSNLRQNIDQAFVRRLRFVIEFPMPNAEERTAIWERSFPHKAKRADDVDIAFLAQRLTLAGGSIQQIALHSAFAAAQAGSPITMNHIVTATKQELVKIGFLDTERTLEGLAA